MKETWSWAGPSVIKETWSWAVLHLYSMRTHTGTDSVVGTCTWSDSMLSTGSGTKRAIGGGFSSGFVAGAGFGYAVRSGSWSVKSVVDGWLDSGSKEGLALASFSRQMVNGEFTSTHST